MQIRVSLEDAATRKRHAKYLSAALLHAPTDPLAVVPLGLKGWRSPEGLCICAHCAGRIHALGLPLPGGSEQVWSGQPFPKCHIHPKETP